MSGAVKHLSFAISLIILISLGSWQLYRLAYKEHLLKTIHAQSLIPPFTTISQNHLPYYQQVSLNLAIETDKPLYLYHIENGQAGYLLFYPALLEQSYLLINIGFVTEKKSSQLAPNIKLDHATILPFAKANLFTPDNEPQNNQWYYLDQKQLSNYLGKEVVPAYIKTQPYQPHIANNHLEYAITWYLLALFLVGIYRLHSTISLKVK